MSDEEIARLLRGLKTTPPKGPDEQEVAGYADLLGRIFDDYKSLKLTENISCNSMNTPTSFRQRSRPQSRYKDHDNVVAAINEKGESVVLFTATPPYLVNQRWSPPSRGHHQNWTKRNCTRYVIGDFIFEFLAIHPFNDGNADLAAR